MRFAFFITCALLLSSLIPSNVARGQSEHASWKPTTLPQLRERLEQWLQERRAPETTILQCRALLEKLPEQPTGEACLAVTIQALRLVEPAARPLLDLCEQPPPVTGVPPQPILADESQSPFALRHLRLWYGSWLARHQLYDEAAEVLAPLRTDEVVDPASLLFYQAVFAHRLLQVDLCRQQLTRLMEHESALSRRQATMAQLMLRDLKAYKPESLDEVSRLMDEVGRRLELGRAGKQVRTQEADIIARLDKLIQQLESQRQQQQQQQQASAGKSPAQQAQGSPAEQSAAPRDLQASDETDPRRYNKASQWGNLPPKERQQALQQIGRDLPAHFRDTIEEYFKRLAQDGID